MVFKNISANGPKRTFIVDFVNDRPTGQGKYDENTVVTLSQQVDRSSQPQVNGASPKLEVVNLAGIDQALRKLNRFLSNFDRQFKFTWAQRSCATLLHGGHGTGKTFLIEKIIATGWGRVLQIESDFKIPAIRSVFKDARMSQPAIIVIDELETLVSKEDSQSQQITRVLGEELDNLSAGKKDSLPRILVIASTLNASSIPMSLKKRGRFRTDISLPIPDAAARKAILRSLSPPLQPEHQSEVLDKLGDRTHAYTAEDLVSLLDTACELAEEKAESSESKETEDAEEAKCYLSQDDIEQALLLVRPTAMHDITLQPPSVRWDEIGGQDNVKKALRRAVEGPLLVSIQIFVSRSLLIETAPRQNESSRCITQERSPTIRSARLFQDPLRASNGHRNRLQLLRRQGR